MITAGLKEFLLLSQTANPPIDAQTNYVWILSSRHGIDEDHVNCPVNSENYTPLAQSDEEQCDIKDGFERIKKALLIGQAVTAKRAKKSITDLLASDYERFAPLIIYNGWPKDNASFHKALNHLATLGLVPYPASKVLIFNMPAVEPHTGGQFTSLANCNDPRLSKMKEGHCNLSIVTSAYHVPRVRRLLTSTKYPNPDLVNAKIAIHAIDRQFKRPCAKRDKEGESVRLINYFRDGKIGAPGNCAWYNERSLASWTPLLWSKRPWLAEQKPIEPAYNPTREEIIRKYDLHLSRSKP